MNKGGKTVAFFVIIFILLVIIFAWGYVGSKEVKKSEGECELSLGKNFCWVWSITETGKSINDSKEYMDSLGN